MVNLMISCKHQSISHYCLLSLVNFRCGRFLSPVLRGAPRRIHNSEPEGDILLFLTGEEEIEQACRRMASKVLDLPREFMGQDLSMFPVPRFNLQDVRFFLWGFSLRAAAKGEFALPGEWRVGVLVAQPGTLE